MIKRKNNRSSGATDKYVLARRSSPNIDRENNVLVNESTADRSTIHQRRDKC
jgi:hypothetical protein